MKKKIMITLIVIAALFALSVAAYLIYLLVTFVIPVAPKLIFSFFK